MRIVYKKLTTAELDTFIKMRIEQLREEGAKDNIDLVPALMDYYSRHIADGTFVSWHYIHRMDSSTTTILCSISCEPPTVHSTIMQIKVTVDSNIFCGGLYNE